MQNMFYKYPKIIKAVEFAAVAHDKAYRKGTNIPFIIHPLEAAFVASSMTDDQDVITAMILHDVIEDTDRTAEDIERSFGKRVLSLVLHETEVRTQTGTAEETWKTRKLEFMERLKKAPIESKIMCLCDKISNVRMSIRTYAIEGDEMWNHFHQKDKKEHEWYYRTIAEILEKDLGEYEAFKRYKSMLNILFG